MSRNSAEFYYQTLGYHLDLFCKIKIHKKKVSCRTLISKTFEVLFCSKWFVKTFFNDLVVNSDRNFSVMDFQRKILQDQREHVLEQFKQVTQQWHELKRSMQENIAATSQAFEDKDKEAFQVPKEWSLIFQSEKYIYLIMEYVHILITRKYKITRLDAKHSWSWYTATAVEFSKSLAWCQNSKSGGRKHPYQPGKWSTSSSAKSFGNGFPEGISDSGQAIF